MGPLQPHPPSSPSPQSPVPCPQPDKMWRKYLLKTPLYWDLRPSASITEECQNLTSYWLGWELFWGVKVLLGLISVGSEKRRVTVYTFMVLLATLTQSTINVEYFGEGDVMRFCAACTGNNHYSLHHPRVGIQWIMRNKNESLYLNCSRNQASFGFLCRVKRSVIVDIIFISMTLIKENILGWLWINNNQSDALDQITHDYFPNWKTLLWLGLC